MRERRAVSAGEERAGVDELTPAECFELLRTECVGRIVYTAGAMPAITPVNYVLDGHHVAFRTAAESRLAQATRDAVVAFEVDAIDRDTHGGWSVVVTGVATVVEDVSTRLRVEQHGLAPWVGGDVSHIVQITPGLVTGRRLHGAVAERSAVAS